MESKVKTLFLALCAIISFGHDAKASEFGSLAWHLLPQNLDDLPMEFDSDDQGHWNEIWLRQNDNDQGAPRSFMEQAVGVRWVGIEPDKNGMPHRMVLVLAGAKVVDITDSKAKTGKIDAQKITWSDGKTENIIGEKRKRRGHRRRGKAVNFGKINLPPLTSRPKEFSASAFNQAGSFMEKLPEATTLPWDRGDLSFLYKLSDPKFSTLQFRISANCTDQERSDLDSLILDEVEPKLTCWAEQNPERSMLLVAALLQRPRIDCRLKKAPSATGEICGEASIPLVESFFVSPPEVRLNFNQCQEEMGQTLLHEILHLSGIKDGEEIDRAIEQAESCQSVPARVSFDGNSEEFMNDLQVETRISLFRKVREEATEKWGWTEGEKDFVLGQICSKMDDKFCARRFFQQASEEYSPLTIPLPEGGEVTFKTAAHFGLYDSITEDLPRMHELSRYLAHDPNGILLRRQETETHRLHEFYVARTTLEKIKNNKGVCNSETDDKVTCEDLSSIVKSPWFKNP